MYIFNTKGGCYNPTGEDLGNIHYGYVGRAAGFSDSFLRTAAGAYQIYSGTSRVNGINLILMIHKIKR
ncbi:polymorphic toxin type 44 domain-containing protein [Bacillus mexicanus]|uniref:polymorphic toxin type 44 domain-containing protein n=1 Tax=Bacillus mexicanus TaxID=2834415 RepID=UPI003D1F76CD